MLVKCQLQKGTKELRDENETLDRTEQVQEGVEVIDDSKSRLTYKDLDPDEIHRLYYEEKCSQLEIAKKFGFKSKGSIQSFLKMMEWEPRSSGFQEIEIDPKEVYRLYFDEGLHMTEMLEHFECKSSAPILRVLEENGWKSKYNESLEIIENIDPEEVYRLYHEEGLSHRKIGEYYGVSHGPICRMFKENNWEYNQEIEVDRELARKLYQQGLSMEKVGEQLDVSKTVVKRVLDELDVELRDKGAQNLEIDVDEYSKLYYNEVLPLEEIAKILEVSVSTLIRFRKEQNLEMRSASTISDMRDEIFGKDCVSCGRPKRDIHRKNGEPHKSELLWRKKELEKLNPDDWVALCRRCHKVTHSLMKVFGCEWDDIEKVLKELRRKYLP